MIENLYIFYREYYSLIFNLAWIILAVLMILGFMKKKEQKKIVIIILLIGFPVISFNTWMMSYRYKFGTKYTALSMEKIERIKLEENEENENFIKKDISIDELLELVKNKEQISLSIEEKNYIQYKFSYIPRPEDYSVIRCEKEVCILMGEIKNKDFINLVEKKIEEEKKK